MEANNPIFVDKHIQENNYSFQRNAKFALPKQATKAFSTTRNPLIYVTQIENY